MRLTTPLIKARLIKRYKRFLADVELATGEVVTVHTANTGSMLGCAEPGSWVWLRDTRNPKRKYTLSWEMVENLNGVLIGIDTQLANRLVEEAIRAQLIPELVGYAAIRREVKFESNNSRFDLFLSEHQALANCFIEVKNVTAIDEHQVAIFPDAVSVRGQKHLQHLVLARQQGLRAAMVYCVQREDATAFRPADEIDPSYAKLLRESQTAGVEIYAYRAVVNLKEIRLSTALEVML
ncbi:MAG: DNA/RNA nuclease SfsA [Gammaproteobacteria bacterium]|nr:DNA/RNA nuclease SfsA [Gammaproteobacteria bacterium]MDH5729095.1 DNA/RNA nuclease SfsA [Gammaproteobacteria bacterium]